MSIAKRQIDIGFIELAEIFDSPNSAHLLRAYVEECMVPDARPQRATYEMLEKSGVYKCFGAHDVSARASIEAGIGINVNVVTSADMASLAIGTPLIGFLTILCAISPHCGERLATVESVFVDRKYRSTGAGMRLLTAAEQYAEESGCKALVASARVNSPFDKVLSRRTGFTLTHNQHTRWFK
jgi:hypothetical protein